MKVYVTIQLDEGETSTKSAADLADDLLAAAGGDPAADTCQVTITSASTATAGPAE